MDLPGLPALRQAIDEVDKQLLELLRKRFELVLKVGEIKRRHGIKVYDPDRERSILDSLAGSAQAPLRAERIRRIFERIIDESRSQEQQSLSEPSSSEPDSS